MKFNDTKLSRWILAVGLAVATVVYAAPGDMPFDNFNLNTDILFTVNDGGVQNTVLELDGATTTVRVPAGAAATPSLVFINDADLGFYRSASNTLGISTGGVAAATITNSNASFTTDVTAGDDVVVGDSIFTSLGAVATPAYSFTGDTNTGMFSEGADEINWATAGVLRLSLGGSMVPTVVIRGPDGTAAAPTYAFSNSTNDGMYSDGTDLKFSVAGAAELTVESGGGITVHSSSPFIVGSAGNFGNSGSGTLRTVTGGVGSDCDAACAAVSSQLVCVGAKIGIGGPARTTCDSVASPGQNRICLCIQ